MRSPGLSHTEMQQCSSDKCKLFSHENVSKKLYYCINCVINSSKQTLWIFNFKVRKYNEVELYPFRKISNHNELFKKWITLVWWVLKGSVCCSKAVDDCPEVKIDDQLVPSVYLPKGKLRLKFWYSTGEPHFDKFRWIRFFMPFSAQYISILSKVPNDEAKCLYAFGEESGELDFDAAQKFCRSKVPPGNCQNCNSNLFVINNEEHHNLVNDNLVKCNLV